MSFRVGQKVVCVNDQNFKADRRLDGKRILPNRPVRGSVYTIRGFYEDDSVYLEEIHNPKNVVWLDGRGEAAFSLLRFRPLVEDKSKTSFTEGAPKDSERFDNRRKIGVDA